MFVCVISFLASGVEDGVGGGLVGSSLGKHGRGSQGAQVPYDACALVWTHLLRGLQVRHNGCGCLAGVRRFYTVLFTAVGLQVAERALEVHYS